ncbi:hypothetical protein Clacol_008655 [Clathrus columnatus]|uniref:Uncharacterized protein n=1 Tax=Clathrus columnatus TaxID=1419009 RepID=A0AAV5APT3_9AGAM|nr:hypothetical protein Clacol_008655 [Clathrus columnatus]
MAEITRESPISSAEALPLDDRLYKLADAELEFLKATVDQDENSIRERVLTVQRNKEYPYPCIWAFHFVDLQMSQNPAYSMGTDVRKLALDGYPASNIVGCDLHAAYINLGHELYQDSNEKCPIWFIADDMFDIPLDNTNIEVEHKDLSDITTLSQLIGRVKYLYIGAVFHLFNESTQLAIAQRLARLVSREKGVVIFGRHQGSETPSVVSDNVWRYIS